MPPPEREGSYRDNDYLKTKEGFLFCVVGNTHPQDRVVSYLKYIPKLSKEGEKWKDFDRVMKNYTIPSLKETMNLLRRSYPKYLFYSDEWNTEVITVPQRDIVKHFIPEVKLEKLMHEKLKDCLIEKTCEFVRRLSELSGVPSRMLGVTGSILLGIHDPKRSDIDITVYGYDCALKIKRALLEILGRDKEIKPLGKREGNDWCLRRVREHPISVKDAERILDRKWNFGYFKGVRFSINPVRVEKESESYGSKRFFPLGFGVVRAAIRSDREAVFSPSIYSVSDVEVIKGSKNIDLREVVSYIRVFSDIAYSGERVEAGGKIELVKDLENDTQYHRLVIGSLEYPGLDYMKLLS